MNSKERFLAACRSEPVDRPPVWLMRQAGRYLPEYRLMRARHGFVEMCKTPELACEVSLQPWNRFGMDAVIVFSDILFIPEAFGYSLSYHEEEGPKLTPPTTLKKVDAESAFSFVYDTIRLIKKKLPVDVPVIGFSGAPWTLAYYSKTSSLDKFTDVIIDYVRLQQEAGADVIQIFDTWAGETTREDFVKLIKPYLQKIADKGRVKDTPFILYCRKCRHILEDLADTGFDVISIDPETKMEEAIKKIGKKVAIQGNLDPKILLTTPGTVKRETSRLLSKIKNRPGHIINLGHGVLKTTLIECVEAFVETVKHV